MNIGDYVRTRWGCIAKFEGINEGFYEFDNIIMDESSAVREELFVDIVEKSSPNIIDLIETGDYVNGSKVLDIAQAPKKAIYTEQENGGALLPIENNRIESILTKEKFESMEYKL